MVDRTRRTGHRLGELHGAERAIVTAILFCFALAPLVAGARSLSAGWQPTGDVAIIAVRSLDAWTGDAPLVGQPTTGEEFTGKPSNHPGPVEYWLLGLTIRILGERAGIVLGAALVASASLGATAWLAYRRGGTTLLALVSVALAGLVHALGASSLHDAFNSELATYPMVLALFAAWSVAVGDLRVTAVLVAAATVAAQVHVAGAAFVAPLLIVAAVALVQAARKHRTTFRKDRIPLLGALAILVIGWLPTIVQEISRGPSNVAALWTTATAPRPRIGLSFMSERVATAVAPIPIFLRSTGRFGFLQDASPIQVVLAALLIAVTASLAIWLRDRDRRSRSAVLNSLVLLATFVALISAAGQPPLAAFRADGTRWLWVTSLGVWVAIVWAGWQLLSDERAERARRWIGPIGAGLAGLLLVATLAQADLANERDGAVMGTTRAAADQLIENLDPGTYRVRFEGNQALVTIGPGIVYRLERAGIDVKLDENGFTRGYGPERTDGGAVDGELRIVSGLSTAADGEELVAEAPIDPDDPDAGTVRVYLSR